MEYYKVEARRLIEIAENKLSENDYDGAKKFVNEAQILYPKLDNLEQVLMMINVYISASNKEGEEVDWYGLLGVDPLADDEILKKQYKKLALLLHPDKNKFNGAEGAFKLVTEAWCMLSDKVKRTSYDQKRRKSKEAKTEIPKQPNPHKPAKAKASSNEQRKSSTFRTMCNRCKTQCEYLRGSNLNKAKLCPNCGQAFIATEIPSGASFERRANLSSSIPQQRQGSDHQNKEPNKTTKNGSSSRISSSPSVTFTWNCSVSVKARSNSGRVANQKPKRSLEVQGIVAGAERIQKKPRTDMRYEVA